MTPYTFAYGDTTVSFSLDERQVLGVLRGRQVAPIDDIPRALTEALNAPTEHVPLGRWIQPGDRIAIIVSDMSRFWMRQDRVVPALIDYLGRHGVSDAQIRIVIANGTHLGGSPEELKRLVTPAIFDRIAVENHDCLAEDLVTLGTTSHGTTVRINRTVATADRVIALGAAVHHVMAGYGGGRKSILPGVSSMETICQNHALALAKDRFATNPAVGNGVLQGNPLHEDMVEAASMLPNLFVINLVMNADMKLAQITAGHPTKSWEIACRAIDAVFHVPVAEQADVVITSCGGYPKDMSLYQGTKTIDNIEPCLKPGGTLILAIEARDGGGPEEYFSWIGPLQDGSFEQKLRAHFTIPGYIFLLNCEQAQRYRILLLTSIPAKTLAPMGIEAYSDMDALLAAANLPGKSIYVVPNGATVIPIVQEGL